MRSWISDSEASVLSCCSKVSSFIGAFIRWDGWGHCATTSATSGINAPLRRRRVARQRTTLLTDISGDTNIARTEGAREGQKMSPNFVRTGELMDLQSYPRWIQAVVQECEPAKRCVAKHELF